MFQASLTNSDWPSFAYQGLNWPSFAYQGLNWPSFAYQGLNWPSFAYFLNIYFCKTLTIAIGEF